MKTWTPTSMHHVNLQHPNWSGRAFRTAREAMGCGLDWTGYDNESGPGFWDYVAIVSVIAAGALVLFVGPMVFA